MSELHTNHSVPVSKMPKPDHDHSLSSLFKALQTLRTEAEFSKFFEDLCTPTELRSMADRWRVVHLLNQGLSYRLIYEKTGVSTATITRVARSLTYGTGGYNMVLKRMPGELP